MNDMNQHRPASAAEQLEQLRKLVEKARVGMLTTIDAAQELRSRPLQTIRMDADGSLWFAVSASSPKAQEMDAHEGRLCVAYSNHSGNEYVSISGHGALVRDPAIKREMWNRIIEMWFPGGVDNPQIAMLKVTPEKAECWDGAGNAVTQLYALAKAMATGNKDAFGDNRKLGF